VAGFLAGGALAQSLVALAFLPWLLHLRAEVASLDKSAPTWMTPADWTNGALVFRYFFPFGPVDLPDAAPWRPATALGLLTSLLPLAFAAVAALRLRGPSDGTALRLGLAGLGV